jgi:L-glyceraldehyde 3-phosphate reductase
MAVAWILRDQPKGSPVTSALIGASSVSQLEDTLSAIKNLDFTSEELAAIDEFAVESDINLWKQPV